MTKAELVDKIFMKANLQSKAQAEKALETVLEGIKDALANGESVAFTGFGTFKVSTRTARKGRNPRTGEELDIPESKVVKFTPGKALKDAIN